MELKKQNIMRALLKRKFCLFPIIPETKRPAIKDNLNLASNKIDQILAWDEQFPNCNWGISLAKSGYVAVDVDWKYGGMEAWAAMIEVKSEPDTLKQITGSGGFHYIFKAKKGTRYIGKIMPGIDVKYNGYVVVYPSKNSDGNIYKWENWKALIKHPEEWLFDLIEKKIRLKNSDEPTYNFGKKYLSRLVDELIKFDFDYHEWVQVGMALHASDPTPEGLDLYLRFTTENDSYMPGDEEKAVDKWESFNSDDRSDAISGATLGYMIRRKGGEVPNPHYQEDMEVFKQGKLEVSTKQELEDGWITDPHNKKFSRNRDWILNFFKEKGFAIFAGASVKDPIIQIKRPGKGRVEVQCQPIAKLNIDYADRVHRFTQFTTTSIKDVDQPAYKCWMEDSRRKYLEEIYFYPKLDDRKDGLNLFEGIPCEPHKGNCNLLLNAFRDSLCGGNKESFNWLMDFLAHLVQRPWEKPTVVPVIIGKQGTGKGLLTEHVMKRILGDLFFKFATSDRIMARFNMSQANRLLTNIDEATWRGNKSEDGFLKNLTGSEFLEVEEKFGLVLQIENFSRYIITSNNAEAVAIEAGNRRYVTIECAEEFAGRSDYFRPIFKELRNGGLYREFFHYLQERDISGWEGYQVPDWDRGGEIAKIKTAGPIVGFWYDMLLENPMEVFHKAKGLNQKLTFEKFLEYVREVRSYEKGISRHEFWKKTADFIPEFPKTSIVRSGERFRQIFPAQILNGLLTTYKLESPEEWKDFGFYYEEDFTDVDNHEDISLDDF